MAKPKPLHGFYSYSDSDLVARATAIQTQMTGNPNFPNPPIDLNNLKTAVETFSALIAKALDGSKTVNAEKNKQREVVIDMLRLLGRYVEAVCKADMAALQTSGYVPAATTRNTAPSLSERIRKIEHGANSGQVLVWLQADPEAASYEIRYAPAANGAPAEWVSQGVAKVKTAVTISGLTPGSAYLFQARALTNAGYTDWTESVTFIAI